VKITELLDELRITYRRHGESPKVTEGWLGLECLFCPHGPFYLGIHIRSGACSCWSCGRHSLSKVISAAAQISYADAKKLTGSLDREVHRQYEGSRGKLELPDGICELLPAHRKYLSRRGFDPDQLAEEWKIQGIGPGVRLQWRIFIPIHRHKEVVTWTTRAIGDVPLTDRYRSAGHGQEIYSRKEILFGEDKARNGIVVHEGPLDVLATGPGAVATCGTGVSTAQVRRIAAHPLRAIAFDAEPAAQRRARELSDLLAVYGGETFVVSLSGHDAADMLKTHPHELDELRKRFLS
jgi:hypothetical protein